MGRRPTVINHDPATTEAHPGETGMVAVSGQGFPTESQGLLNLAIFMVWAMSEIFRIHAEVVAASGLALRRYGL